MDFKTWLEARRDDIARLRPDSVIPVYHGTSMTHAVNFCLNGINAKQTGVSRVYNHRVGKQGLTMGIFVAPDPDTAFKFGNVIVKFPALAKNLHYQVPNQTKEVNKWKKPHFPGSFRPSVSDDMLNNQTEPQALFIGHVSPRAIQKVYVSQYGAGKVGMTREEFLRRYMDDNQPRDVSAFEPQEYNITFDQFIRRLAARYNMGEDEARTILQNVYNRSGRLTGVGTIPHTLKKRMEMELRRRSVPNRGV